MNLRHTFIFDGTPQEFLESLENRGQAEFEHYLDNRSEAKPFIYNGLEYTTSAYPERAGIGGSLYRLEYYATGTPLGMNVWEQIEKNIYPTKELGIVIETTPQLNGQTKVVASCLHPAYEQEFRAFFIDSQEQSRRQATGSTSLRVRPGPRDYGQEEKQRIVEHYLERQDSITQERYAAQWNMSARQFRRWLDAYRKGEL